MGFLTFDSERCNLCGLCIEQCPFQAMSMEASGIEVNEKCRMCGLCVKNCPADRRKGHGRKRQEAAGIRRCPGLCL